MTPPCGPDLRRDVVGIEREGVIDLGEHGHRACVHDRADRRDERERADDHLVATPDAERGQRAA